MNAASPRVRGEHLVGRGRERSALDQLLQGAREANGGALVVHGEPGVGKTALINYAVEAADGFQTARISGVEGEMELPFAAAQQLCAPFTGLIDRLPQPQSEALRVAFGIAPGPAPNPFFVGLAVLGLLSEAAEGRPLLVVVDDAQWLDRASAEGFAFVARRLLAEKIAIVIATRAVGDTLNRLPELGVEPLGRGDARALLESVLPAPLDDRVMGRIIDETRGNPLALIELPRGLTSAQLAGGFGLSVTAPLASGIEEGFKRRWAGLPQDARRLLLIAASDPVGDPALVRRAAQLLEIPESAVEAIESEDLLTIGSRVTFRHPLVRSAVYRAAEPKDRREVHSALADATDQEVDPDRRAWHRAQAATSPDEQVAADLERSASRAQARGGSAAAGAFLERAAALTPEPSSRARRALAAARTMLEAGALDDSRALLDTIESVTASEDEIGARVGLLRAQITFASRRGSDAAPLLLRAARELEQVDSALARATYLEALTAATFAGRLAQPEGDVVAISEAALAGPPMPEAPAPSDLLLQGLALKFTAGYSAAAPVTKEALRAFQQETALPPSESRWLWYASWIALHMWDDGAWAVLSTRHLDLIRQTGALSELPVALANMSSVYAFLGDMRAADAVDAEAKAASEATGISAAPYGTLALAALRGRESEFSDLAEAVLSDAEDRGEGLALTVTEFLRGALYNGLGRYQAALAAVEPAEPFYIEGPAIWTLTELVEAAVRCDQREQASRAFERVQGTTSAAGTDWGLGIEARLRALLAEDDDAEAHYEEAVARLGRTSIRIQLARTHLLYGEWLRRRRRRLDAREQLRIAHELFSDSGIEAFAERTRVELEATGERARKRSTETVDQLTAQESEISRLVAEGLTNREIATRLFISPSTVEYHLRKVFRKLDVKSRTQLARRLT